MGDIHFFIFDSNIRKYSSKICRWVPAVEIKFPDIETCSLLLRVHKKKYFLKTCTYFALFRSK